MALDTNVKEFKYSKAKKAICILLSLITLLTAVGLGAMLVMTGNYSNGGDMPENFTDSSTVSHGLIYRVSLEIQDLYGQAGREDEYDGSSYGWFDTYPNVNVYIESKDFPYTYEYNFDTEGIYNQDYYFVYKDGKIQSQGISSDTCQEIIDKCLTNDETKAMNIYLYLQFPESNNIFKYFDDYSAIVGARDFYNQAVKCYNHWALYTVLTVIMTICSFIFAFSYFLIAGKRSKDQPAKLAFIDYIPFEIHLLIVVGLGALASFLVFLSLDCSYFSLMYLMSIILYALIIWLLLFEYCSSVARYALSDKKFYKNFLVYLIGKLIYRLAKGSIKLDGKIARSIKESSKKTHSSLKNLFSILTYKPTKFKRNVLVISILYALANLIALAILFFLWMWAFDWGEVLPTFLAIVATLADLGANIFVLAKILNYIKQLDTIIGTASKHQSIDFDVNTLPLSLKTLAESMEYTNAELQSAVARAVKDERLKTELITNVSHDLKTPLTSIITYVDLLSKCDIQDENAQEYIKVLEEKSGKLKRLIDDLIEASKVTSGNITVNLTSLNLYELCLQATIDAQKDFDKAQLELIVKDNGNPPTILADGPKSFRVIENLLSNARKYSAKNSRVYVNVYEDNGMGVFEIKNISAQPLDISPDELTQRFVRGDKSRNQDGNGLGLSIAKELCKAQKGDLEISIDGDLFKAKAKLPLA